MPRAAKKAIAKPTARRVSKNFPKLAVKSTGKVKPVPRMSVKQAQQAFDQIQKESTSTAKRLQSAQTKLAQQRSKVKASPTATNKNGLVRLRDEMESLKASVATLRGQLKAAKQNLTLIRQEEKQEVAQQARQEREQLFLDNLAERAEQDLQNALSKFEAKWRKERARKDAAKLKTRKSPVRKKAEKAVSVPASRVKRSAKPVSAPVVAAVAAKPRRPRRPRTKPASTETSMNGSES